MCFMGTSVAVEVSGVCSQNPSWRWSCDPKRALRDWGKPEGLTDPTSPHLWMHRARDWRPAHGAHGFHVRFFCGGDTHGPETSTT